MGIQDTDIWLHYNIRIKIAIEREHVCARWNYFQRKSVCMYVDQNKMAFCCLEFWIISFTEKFTI